VRDVFLAHGVFIWPCLDPKIETKRTNVIGVGKLVDVMFVQNELEVSLISVSARLLAF